MRRALKVLSDREVTPQLGLLKSTLLQLDSTFSERSYGASSFRDFVEKLAERGLVTLKQSGRSLLVELADSAVAAGVPDSVVAADQGSGGETADTHPSESGDGREPAGEDAGHGGDERRAEAGPEQANGVRTAAALFANPRQAPRWPMYIRQIRQYLRILDETFDERKFGFTGIVEFLRACQREGLLRLERDRQGVMRVFAGPAFGRTAADAGASEPATEDRPADEPEAATTDEAIEDARSPARPRFTRITDEKPAATGLASVAAPQPRAVEEDDSVGPGNEAEPGAPPPTRRARKTTTRTSTRKAAATRAPRATRARKTARTPKE